MLGISYFHGFFQMFRLSGRIVGYVNTFYNLYCLFFILCFSIQIYNYYLFEFLCLSNTGQRRILASVASGRLKRKRRDNR